MLFISLLTICSIYEVWSQTIAPPLTTNQLTKLESKLNVLKKVSATNYNDIFCSQNILHFQYNKLCIARNTPLKLKLIISWKFVSIRDRKLNECQKIIWSSLKCWCNIAAMMKTTTTAQTVTIFSLNARKTKLPALQKLFN